MPGCRRVVWPRMPSTERPPVISTAVSLRYCFRYVSVIDLAAILTMGTPFGLGSDGGEIECASRVLNSREFTNNSHPLAWRGACKYRQFVR